MGNQSGWLYLTLAVTATCFLTLVPGSSAQVRLEFTGSTEFPSIKCVTNPQQISLDLRNKTVCFCVWIQNVIPTWNCIRGDGKVTVDDLKFIVGTIRNLTNMIPLTTSGIDPSFGTEPTLGERSSQQDRFTNHFRSASKNDDYSPERSFNSSPDESPQDLVKDSAVQDDNIDDSSASFSSQNQKPSKSASFKLPLAPMDIPTFMRL